MSAIFERLGKAAGSLNELNAKYNAIPFEEQKAMTFLERVKVYNWTIELYGTALLIAIVVAYMIGTSLNTSRADKLFKSLHQGLKNDLKFARVGVASRGSSKLYLDQHLHTWFTSFATGRSAIESVAIKVHLLSRNNPISIIIEYLVNTFIPALALNTVKDYIEIEIKPNGVHVGSESANVNADAKQLVAKNFNFIASIVNKNIMTDSRDNNYFLSLTHVTENDKLPVEYVYMSELNQLNDFFLKYAKGNFINEILKKSTDLLQFISFTDLPAAKPLDEKNWNATIEPRCVILTNIPSNKTELELLNQVIAGCVEIYDNYTRDLVQKTGNVVVTNDMLKKATQLRAQELQKIIKAAKEVELENSKESKKEAERERRRELKKSGELEKIDKKMKEKRERRQKNKQRTRA